MLKKWIMAVVLVGALVCTAWAAVPQAISYQGYLKNADGTPVNGTRTMTFAIYDTSSGAGAPLWVESQGVTATNGIFSVHLGSVSPLPASLFDNASLYLELRVGSDPEMTPRQQLTSTPFSFHAATADSATSLAPDAVATANLADSSVTAPKIADGAVTDAKISGTISGAKISSAGLNASTLSGIPATGFAAAAHAHSAADLASGTVADARLSANVDLLNTNQTISGVKAFNPASGNVPFSVDATKGGMVTNLNAEMVSGQKLTDLDARYTTNTVKTNVSYADPAWITSLAGSKITGNIAGNAATATTATSAASFSGALSGDVTGTQGSTTVTKIQGRPVTATVPTTGQVLKWNDTQWEPMVDNNSGGTVTSVTVGTGLYGGTITASGTIGIMSHGITNTMLADGAVTDAKISGTISGAKISSTGLNASTLSGIPATGFAASVHTHSATDLTGTVPVANGGTGTSNGSITGTGSLDFVAGGTNNNVYLVPSGSGSVDVTNKRIVNMATPTAPTDAATKGYVDSTMVSGCVNSNGSVYSGSGFSAALTGTGSYNITFTQPFPSSPAVVLTPITGTGAMACQLSVMSTGSAGVVCVNSSNAQVATAFCFMAR